MLPNLAAILTIVQLLSSVVGLFPNTPRQLIYHSKRILRLNAVPRSNEATRRRQEVINDYGLDRISVEDLRMQIKARGSSYQGLFERQELVQLLAQLIVTQQDQIASQDAMKLKNSHSKAQLISEKRRLMKNMTLNEMKYELEAAGITGLVYRDRDDVESALALLWLGELRPEDDSVILSDPVEDTINFFGDVLGNITSSIGSSLGMAALQDLAADLSSTASEKMASAMVSTERRSEVDDEATKEALTVQAVIEAKQRLSFARSFDEAVRVCGGLSKQLMIDLLESEYHVHVDSSTPHATLTHILSDSVMLRRRIVQNYKSDAAVVEPVQRPVVVKSAARAAAPSSPSAHQSHWQDYIVPEKELLLWFMTSAKALGSKAKEVSHANLGLGRSVFSVIEAALVFGVEATLRIGEWAAGSRQGASLLIFFTSAVTMASRRGVSFFFGVLCGLGLFRIALTSGLLFKLGEDRRQPQASST